MEPMSLNLVKIKEKRRTGKKIKGNISQVSTLERILSLLLGILSLDTKTLQSFSPRSKMKFTSILALAGAITPAIAAPAKSDKTCSNPAKRIEWRELDAADQQGYIDAVLCLKTRPSRMGLKSSLYDDFPHLHFQLNSWSKCHLVYLV